MRLLIEDDGVGIPSQTPNPGAADFGMAGMRERIGNIGGKMKMISSRGKGTRIEVNAPVMNAGVAAASQTIRRYAWRGGASRRRGAMWTAELSTTASNGLPTGWQALRKGDNRIGLG